jgi:oxalate decarboxylase/phosphoglucose isomerase-like protein (cupin superfamily)
MKPWHGSPGEYYISGEFRTGIFAAQSADNTFDFQAGDVGYIKQNNGHWSKLLQLWKFS